jgi:hypothetical protein
MPHLIWSGPRPWGRHARRARKLYASGRKVGSKIKVVCQFRYACPFNWHFRYQHAVDDHNNLCHGLPSVEDSWTTQQWEIQVFLFVLAISEVNAFLALRYFTFAKGTIPGCPTLIVFCRQLAWQLIRNSWIVSAESAAGMEGVSSGGIPRYSEGFPRF